MLISTLINLIKNTERVKRQQKDKKKSEKVHAKGKIFAPKYKHIEAKISKQNK